MKKYKLYNNLIGWSVFVISAVVYLKTLQPTVSFWDCGEFISSVFKQQVGHQPGAPLFVMIARMFSLMALNPSQAAFWVNVSSAMASAATVMFLFWTITAISLKLYRKESLNTSGIFTVLAAGIIGSLAYAFSDSFWFSAVEAEVYSLSALCTAITFWAALKWDSQADSSSANRWLVFISFILGLSIGVHLLNLLTVPAIVLIYYFRKTSKITVKGLLLSLAVGCFVLGFIQYGVIQYLVYFASRFDLFFVNNLGSGFGYGAIFFLISLVGVIVWGISYSIKKKRYYLNLGLICLSFILLGYTSYALIIIRANAKTFVNVSNPDNPVTLFGYLGRDQYADRPLAYGQYFDANITDTKNGDPIYRKGKKKYEQADTKFFRTYDHNTFLPRIYSDKPEHIAFYRNWLGLGEHDSPTLADNFNFLTTYQLGYMYWRYFLWNFAGKQDDVQGDGGTEHGNWITGIKALDTMRLGNQSELPKSISMNAGHNRLYALPLILGLMGLIYLIRKNRRDALVTMLLFFFTGMAIILYLNQTPIEPRERDYAYAGSFYVFAIWIGLGVLAVHQLLGRIPLKKAAPAFAFGICLVVPLIMAFQGWDDHDRSENSVAHDMAVNYLQSCAPNAILFTNADNDTYPLWYAQSVENIRTDVRIVNLQLLYNDSYLNQLKKQVFQSAPLPVTMPEEKYVQGVRDVLPFVDYGFRDSVELKDALEVMLSDNESDKVELQDGSKENFLPTKRLKLSVDPVQVIRTGTLPKTDREKIADKLEWSYNKNYVSRADLAVLDILAHNNWERPIYFTAGVSEESYMGLDRYLYSEGYAYRLLPLKRDIADERRKEELSNNTAMYEHLMNKFLTGAFRKPKYLDPESRNISNMTWDNFNTLAFNLYNSGQPEASRKVMNKALKTLPIQNYSLADSVNKYRAAVNLYPLNDAATANALIKDVSGFLANELNYYASLNEDGQRRSAGNIRYIVSVLEACKKLVLTYNQPEIARSIDEIYRQTENKLLFSQG